jgi:hypothetical protein
MDLIVLQYNTETVKILLLFIALNSILHESYSIFQVLL